MCWKVNKKQQKIKLACLHAAPVVSTKKVAPGQGTIVDILAKNKV